MSGMDYTTIDPQRTRELLKIVANFQLRNIIATERAAGRAFGVVAEACRDELAKRCERE